MTRPAGAKNVRFRTIRTRNPSRYRSVAHHLALYLCLLLVMLVAQGCGGEQTPTPTATPEAVASPSATSTHTLTPDPTPTDEPPPFTPTLEPTPSPSPTQTDTPTPDPTPTEVPPTSTATLEPAPSPAPTQTDTPTPDPTPTNEPPTFTPTLEPTPSPSPTQTGTPTPVATPTDEPPTFTPTLERDAFHRRRTCSAKPTRIRMTASRFAPLAAGRSTIVDCSEREVTLPLTRRRISTTKRLPNANINVLTVPARGVTSEELAAASKEQFKIMVTDFTLLGETFLRYRRPMKLHLFEYTFSQGVFPLRGTQLIIVYEDTAYAITATALDATWDKYESAFDASLRSLRFLADSPSPRGTNTPDPDPADGDASPTPTGTPDAVDPQSPGVLGPPYSNSTEGFELRPPYGWV